MVAVVRFLRVLDGDAFAIAGEARHLQFGRLHVAFEFDLRADPQIDAFDAVRRDIGENRPRRGLHHETVREDMDDLAG
jgi:hypothetical protein